MARIEGQFAVTAQDHAESRTVLTPPGQKPGDKPTRPPPSKARVAIGFLGWALFVALLMTLYVLLNRQTARMAGRPARPVMSRPLVIGVAGLGLGFAMFAVGVVVSSSSVKKGQTGQHTTVVLDDEGVHLDRPGRRDLWRWGYFTSFAETQNLFVLRHALHRGRLIPKRAFSSGEHVAAARELIAVKLLPPPPPPPSSSIQPPPLPPRSVTSQEVAS